MTSVHKRHVKQRSDDPRKPRRPAWLERAIQTWRAWRAPRAQAMPLVEEYEARLLYSADLPGAGLALASAGDVVEQRFMDDHGEFTRVAQAQQRTHEMLIVGAGIGDSQTLLNGLARDGRDIEVLLLDPAVDSVDQIGAALAGRSDLTAIHILSHGSSGQLQLGADTLDAAMLATRASDLGHWGDALRPRGDILLYGCDVAAGDAGAAFVRQFSALTGADVAASDNLTGDRNLQGDWTLEFSIGGIESAGAFTAAAEAQWHGTLETRANTVTQDKQHEAAVAVSASGSFIVTWTADHDQDGNNTGVFAQRFNASGDPVGNQIQVNTGTNDRQEMSAVGIAADGTFVVAWASHKQQAGDTDSWSVKAQRFAVDGSKVGSEFLVNQTTAKDQWQPSIAMAADGQFVIAWTSSSAGNDIYVRHYDAAGNPLHDEVLASGVNSAGNQTLPSVAIAVDGSYVVVWQTDNGGTAKSIYAQRFNADDTLRGAGFKVNTNDADDQTQPSVALGANGAFVIAWTSAKQDSDGDGVYAQLYRPDGSRSGAEFLVNTVTQSNQSDATTAMDGAGNFTIAWNSSGEDTKAKFGIYAQRYNSAGTPLGGPFAVNTTTGANQSAPAASMNAGGALAIAWEGAGVGDTDGVFVASYAPANTTPTANADAASLLQGGQVGVTGPSVLANDTDPDSGSVLTVSALLSPADGSVLAVTASGINVAGLYGTLLLRADGSYLYSADTNAAKALGAGKSGSDVFTYFIRDNNNAGASSTLTFTVMGTNDVPVARDDAYAVSKLDSLSIMPGGVLVNDTDLDGNPTDVLTVALVNNSAALVGANVNGNYGTLRVEIDGSLTYVPNSLNGTLITLVLGQSVTDTFSYQVSDGKGGVHGATIRITIQGGNAAPLAVDDGVYTVQQDAILAVGAAGVLANDSDPDGNTLSAQLNSGPSHGTLALNADGSFVYTPVAGYSGADSFSYRASDGSLNSPVATVTLNVTHINHGPSATSDSVGVNENATIAVNAGAGLLINDADTDGDALTVTSVQYQDTIITVPAGATGRIDTDYGTLLVGSDGAFSYAANGAASMTLGDGAVTGDAFIYTISDGNGGTSRAELAIAITGVNNAPVVTVSAGAQSITDKGSLQPFSSVTISDVDSPAQQLTLRVTLDDATRGRLAGMTGNYDAANGIYTFTGLAADATAAVRALSFTPTENRLSPGLTDTTSFTIRVDDGLVATFDSSVTVATISVNDAPQIGGAVAAQAISDQTSLEPFSSITIADADNPAQQLTVLVMLDVPSQGMLWAPAGSYDPASGVYTFTGAAADATAALRALVFTPTSNRITPGLTETTRLTISADDGLVTTSTATTTVVATSTNDTPFITGTAAAQTVPDNTDLHLFAGITIADADSPAQSLSVRVALDDPSHGALAGGAGRYDGAIGVYTFTGTAAEATSALRALVFTPTPNRVAAGTTETTRFSINIDDSLATATDAVTSVVSISVNDTPSISGTAGMQAVADRTNLQPFANVTITDADSPAQRLVVRVALDDPAKGTLFPTQGGSYDAVTGIYTFNGSTAEATAAVSALLFAPTANRLAPGAVDTTRFTITADDGLAISTDVSVTVAAISINDAPLIANTPSQQTVDDTTSLKPFANVTITDADSPAQSLTVRVTLDDPARGTLSGAGGSYDPASGVYRFIGTAAQASDALRELVFRPAANRVAPGASEIALLTLAVDDGQAGSRTATHIAALSVNDAPVLDLPAGLQTVSDKDSLAPFAGMTVADADSPAQQLTLRISLNDPASGKLTGAAGSYEAATGVYAFSGTAAQLNAAVQAVRFAPAENRVAPGHAETVAFSIVVSDGTQGTAGVVTVQSLSIDDAPTVLAVSARSAQDGALLPIVLAASDPDGDDIRLVIASAPPHGTLYLDAAGLSPLLPGALVRTSGNIALLYYRAEAGWNGDTSFSYAAVDVHGLSGPSAVVSITITPAPRDVAQTTSALITDTAAVPPAPAPRTEKAEQPAATPTLLGATGTSAAPARQPDITAPPPELGMQAQPSQQAVLAATPPRISGERGSQVATMLAVIATGEAGGDAALDADLRAAQAMTNAGIERASAAARSETLARNLDEMREGIKAAEEAEHRIVGSSVAVGASFSVGYVIWLLRGGVLATSLLSSLPAWRFVDPLPVLARMRQDSDDDTDDSLESLVAGDGRSDIEDRSATSGRLESQGPTL